MGNAGNNIPTKRMAANSCASKSLSHLTISEDNEKNNDDIVASSIPRILIFVFGVGKMTGVTGEFVDGVSDSITKFLSSNRSAIYVLE
jgi:hypothetical protein